MLSITNYISFQVPSDDPSIKESFDNIVTTASQSVGNILSEVVANVTGTYIDAGLISAIAIVSTILLLIVFCLLCCCKVQRYSFLEAC